MRPPWTAQSCKTCQKRHVKCSRERPFCQVCRKRSLVCGGYYEQPRYIVPKKRDAVTPMTRHVSFSRPQEVVTQFLQSFVTSHNMVRRTIATWYLDFPKFMGASAMFDTAAASYSMLFLGRRSGNKTWVTDSLELYTKASNIMVRAMGSPLIWRHSDQLLTTAMLMALYEFVNPSSGPTAWRIHIQAARKVLQLRGPPSAARPLNLNVYRSLRILIMMEAYYGHQRLFLEDPKWHLGPATGELYDSIRDIFFTLPGIIEDCDRIRGMDTITSETVAVASDMWCRFAKMESAMMEWYARLQVEEDPIYYIYPTPTGTTIPNARSEVRLLFPGMLYFTTQSVTEMLMLYWHSAVLVYTNILHVRSKLAELRAVRDIGGESDSDGDSKENVIIIPGEPTEEEYAGMDQMAFYYARLICQSVGFCLDSTRGIQTLQVLIAGLWATQEYFRSRNEECYEWCRLVLLEMSRKGYGLSGQASGRPPPNNFTGGK